MAVSLDLNEIRDSIVLTFVLSVYVKHQNRMPTLRGECLGLTPGAADRDHSCRCEFAFLTF